MAKAFFVAITVGLLSLSGMPKSADATVTFSLVWQATTGTGVTGTNVTFAQPGDVLTLAIRMTTDQTLQIHSVTIDFDTDLGNELNLFNPNGGKNWAGTTYGTSAMTSIYSELVPLGYGLSEIVESTSGVRGRIQEFNSGVSFSEFVAPLPVGTYTVGTARFVSNGGTTDGADVFIGILDPRLDAVIDGLGNVIPASGLVFGSASINGIPEPSTAVLFGMGLVGIIAFGRRSRRS